MAEFKDRNSLKIDSVLSTQSELGPSIPDGGYGWIILLATMFFQVCIVYTLTLSVLLFSAKWKHNSLSER